MLPTELLLSSQIMIHKKPVTQVGMNLLMNNFYVFLDIDLITVGYA